jgi:hypothetical protein
MPKVTPCELDDVGTNPKEPKKSWGLCEKNKIQLGLKVGRTN